MCWNLIVFCIYICTQVATHTLVHVLKGKAKVRAWSTKASNLGLQRDSMWWVWIDVNWVLSYLSFFSFHYSFFFSSFFIQPFSSSWPCKTFSWPCKISRGVYCLSFPNSNKLCTEILRCRVWPPLLPVPAILFFSFLVYPSWAVRNYIMYHIRSVTPGTEITISIIKGVI